MEEIERTKALKEFLVSWGMAEASAKVTALRIVFKIDVGDLLLSQEECQTSTLKITPERSERTFQGWTK